MSHLAHMLALLPVVKTLSLVDGGASWHCR